MKKTSLSTRLKNTLLKGTALVVSALMVVTFSFPAVTARAAVSDLAATNVFAGHSLLASPAMSLSMLPVGTIIYSDSFPGFYILFNGQKSYVIKAGENKVDLDITVTDTKLAAESAAAIKLLFGTTVTNLVKGTKLIAKATMTGLPKGEEKTLITAFAASGISDEMLTLLPASNKTEINVSDAKGLVKAIVEAVKQEEKSVAQKEEAEKQAAPSDKTSPQPENTPAPIDDGDEDDDYKYQSEPQPDPEPVVHYDQERVVMLYATPTNLEPDFGVCTENLLDILRAGIPDNTRMFIVTGGTLLWYMDDISAYKNYAKNTLYPGKDSGYTAEEEKNAEDFAKSLLQLHSTKVSGMQYWEVVCKDGVYNLSKIKDVNGYMTDNNQLTDFIDYCTGQTNAKYYDLLLYGHGTGIGGYGGDDLLKKYYAENPGVKQDLPQILSITDLSDAFAATELFKSGRKLEVIGFDACKMGNYEVASALSPYADYFVASEEIAPGRGWNYYGIFNELSNNSTMSSETLVSGMVDAYMAKFNAMGGADKGIEATLSASNLIGVEFLDEALNELYKALVTEMKDDKAFFDISNAIGKVSNFEATNGFNAADEFDIKLFCESLLTVDYPNIKEKSTAVLNALDECMVNAQQIHTNKGENFGGLYMYFPANAFCLAYSKEKTGADASFINSNVNSVLETLRKLEISEEYDKLINLFAFLQASGIRIGNDWVTCYNGTYQDVIGEMANYDEYKSVLNTVKQNPDIEALAKNVVDKQLSDRVTKEDVTVLRGYTDKITTDESGKKEITLVDNPDAAVITVTKGEIMLEEDETADVRVTADLDGNKVLLGRTELYSEDVLEGIKDSENHTSAHWNISKFDNKWYTINDQLSGFFVTETQSENNYSGYIPIAIWFDKNLVAGAEGQSRDEYVRSALSAGNGVRTFVINVQSENGNLVADTMTAYTYDNFAESFSISELSNSYVELLGGFEQLVDPAQQVFSLGTIYTEDGFLDIERRYVEGLTSEYVLTDAYGSNYVLSNANIGENGLDSFVKEIPADQAGEAFTWEESKENAAEIREKAKEEVQAAQARQAAQTQQEGDGTQTQPEGDGTQGQQEGDGTQAQPEGDGAQTQPEGDGAQGQQLEQEPTA